MCVCVRPSVGCARCSVRLSEDAYISDLIKRGEIAFLHVLARILRGTGSNSVILSTVRKNVDARRDNLVQLRGL